MWDRHDERCCYSICRWRINFAIIGNILKPKSFAGLFASRTFGRTRNAAPHDLRQRSNIRGRRSTRDDRRRDRAIYLCELRQLRVDAVQDARACWEPAIHPPLAGCRYWLATGLSIASMRVSIDVSSVRRTTAFEYAIRFLLGGIITAVTGLIANRYGAAAVGLFHAFPAIFPASVTRVEKHEIEKKHSAGLHGSIRGREAAALEAAGAAIGSIGLFGFAIFVGRFAGRYRSSTVLLSATLVWFATAGLIWRLRKNRMLKRLKARLYRGPQCRGTD